MQKIIITANMDDEIASGRSNSVEQAERNS
jgi:hypothetical protein